MIEELTYRAEAAAARTARTAVMGAGAVAALVLGAFFLTLAAWLFLAEVTSVITAALILGAAYMGLGLLFLGMLSIRRRARQRELARARAAQAASSTGSLVQLIMAFITGIRAGKTSRHE